MKSLTERECKILLRAAREAIVQSVKGNTKPNLDIESLPKALQQPGATFVTLRKKGVLRGCVGTLEALAPLVEDVCDRAIGAALHDYRFPPLCPEEVNQITIEISYLSNPEPLQYKDAQDLLSKIKPGVDGVVLRYGSKRATFLPQVWESIPNPENFLSRLCEKMGMEFDIWRKTNLDVFTYQVEKICES